MKKILKIIGSIIAALLVGFVAIGLKGAAMDKECETFIDCATSTICNTLSYETLLEYGSPLLIEKTSRGKFERANAVFRALGPFKGLIRSSGSTYPSFKTIPEGSFFLGKYVAHVEFENGPADILIGAVKIDGDWKISMFRIYSPVTQPGYYPPFVKAAQQGNIAEAERLLKSGELVNQTTIGNQTPLHIAAAEGQDAMVQWLLSHKANPLAQDLNGKTPADFAMSQGHTQTAQLILNYVGNVKEGVQNK